MLESRQPTRVLLVEDDGAAADEIRGFLSDSGPGAETWFELTHVRCAEEAAATIAERAFDVVLVDLAARSVTRSSFLGYLRETKPSLPIVIVAGPDGEADAAASIADGAQEYLIRGRDDGAQFARAIRYAIEKKRAEERVRFLAYHDPLTGLPNRGMFRTLLEQAMARARRHNTLVALMMLDVDRFKWINESLGDGAGDQLLQAYARRLRGALRECDVIARLGADEFAVIVEDMKDRRAAETIADKILHLTDEPFDIGETEVYVTTSIGIAIYPTLESAGPESLASAADIALYRAKDDCGNKYCVFTPEMHRDASGRVRIDTELRYAVSRDELVLHFQPQVDLGKGVVEGVEALVRWQHPKLGLLQPADFISVAEDSGMIVAIGEWVMHRACRDIAAMHARGFPDLKVAVNISALQFRQGNLADVVRDCLQATGIPPRCLDVELTESILVETSTDSRETLEQLKRMGVQISIDDFGTGYSSLAYLQHFPLDTLKIDRSFVVGIGQDSGSEAIAKAVISMARALDLRVVAEGVETEEQLAFLRALGCDSIQGFLFSRPVPIEELEAILRKPLPHAPDARPRTSIPTDP